MSKLKILGIESEDYPKERIDTFKIENDKGIFEKLKRGNVLFIAGKNHIIRQEPFLRKLESYNRFK